MSLAKHCFMPYTVFFFCTVECKPFYSVRKNALTEKFNQDKVPFMCLSCCRKEGFQGFQRYYVKCQYNFVEIYFWGFYIIWEVIFWCWVSSWTTKIAKRFALCAHSPSPPLNIGAVWAPVGVINKRYRKCIGTPRGHK